MSTQDTFERYSRQVFMEEIGVEGQRKIMAAKVLVIGAGGIGSPVIQLLAAAGVGDLAVVDFDRVELHNLNRQTIHTEAFMGVKKVESAAAYVRSANSTIKFSAIDKKITKQNAETLMSGYDIIVDGSDNFTTRYLVNDTCVRLGKVLVYGSILSFQGQVALFNYEGGKNLRDLFAEAPLPEDAPDCDRNGVLGPLPGMVGSVMAMEVLKIIIGKPSLMNQLLIIDAMHWNFSKINF